LAESAFSLTLPLGFAASLVEEMYENLLIGSKYFGDIF